MRASVCGLRVPANQSRSEDLFIWKYCNLRCLSKIVVEGTSYNWMLRQAKRKDHRHFSHSAILSIFTLPNLQNLQQEPRGAVPFGCRIYCCLFTKGRTCNQTVMSGRRLNRFIDFAAFLPNVDSACRGLFSSFLVRNWCGRVRRHRPLRQGGSIGGRATASRLPYTPLR